jgi:NitT/TauT family transport system substrate-binding protein
MNASKMFRTSRRQILGGGCNEYGRITEEALSARPSVAADRRRFLTQASAVGIASIFGVTPGARAEPPPETTTIRFDKFDVSCIAPQFVADSLLRAEGFTNVQYIRFGGSEAESDLVGENKVDMNLYAVGPLITSLDAGSPIVVLGGVRLGCYELFGTERVRSIRDLKGKAVPVEVLGGPKHVLLSSMAAYVGLDPRKDIRWVIASSADAQKMFAEGKVDAFLGFPPEPQQLRAKKIGRVIVNTATDKPWSQYFCCMLNANRDFVQKYPVATKRALRAVLKAADLCAREPQRIARLMVEQGFMSDYELALETFNDVRYDAWRTHDANNSIRFHALRLHEVGMIKSSPDKIIAQGTDWRF